MIRGLLHWNVALGPPIEGLSSPPPCAWLLLDLQIAFPCGGDGFSSRFSHLLHVRLAVPGESQVIGDEVKVLASRALDDDHTLLVGVLAEGLLYAHLAYRAVELYVLHGLQLDDLLGGGDATPRRLSRGRGYHDLVLCGDHLLHHGHRRRVCMRGTVPLCEGGW